ncbi:glycosyl hydrolase [Actinomycetota bacterium]|nr:glycosyl hydrolase [Actinomycetota bacterium]
MTLAPDAAATPGTEAALADALRTVRSDLAVLGDRFPGDTTHDGVYLLRRPAVPGEPEGGNTGWTTSFWTGELWLAYDLTGDESLRAAAEGHAASLVDRVERGVDLDTHDLGFLYTLGCVLPWRRTGDARARAAALAAADHLMTRFLEPAGIIQAWGDLADPAQRGRTIIDSLMNTPLLYWASEQTGDPRYHEAAQRHSGQVRDHIIRPDDSTFHTFFWDPTTGAPLHGGTAQGNGDSSCWARGQAWGIYGFALNHRYTGDPSFQRAARRCADYFLAHLPADRVPYWDLEFGDGSGQERDSSAAAIAVCGLRELAQGLPAGEDRTRYLAAAEEILDALITGYATAGAPGGGLLLHGVYNKPEGDGVDEGTLWGDYYYLEALTRRLDPAWVSVW